MNKGPVQSISSSPCFCFSFYISIEPLRASPSLVSYRYLFIYLSFFSFLLIQSDAKKLYRRIRHLRSDPRDVKSHRSCCFGLCGRKVDLVDQYGKRLENLEENVRLEQSGVSFTGKVSLRDSSFLFQNIYNPA